MFSNFGKMNADTKLPLHIKQEIDEDLLLNVLASQNVFATNDDDEENASETDDESIEDEMEIDAPAYPDLNEKVDVKIRLINENLVKLSIDGIPDSSDDEDDIILSSKDVHRYLKMKIRENMADPAINPLLALTNRSQELKEEFKDKYDKLTKVNKLFEMMTQNQEKFLRHMGVLEKIPTKTVAISTNIDDYPPLMPPHSIPQVSSNPQESLLKKNVSARKRPKKSAPLSVPPRARVKKEPPKRGRPGKKRVPSSSPIECIDLTDEPDIPNRSVARSPFAYGLMNHPAPLPPRPFPVPNRALPNVPPKPRVKIHAEDRGIVLQWDLPPSTGHYKYAKPGTYDLFGYHEQANLPINSMLWKKIGSVQAMTLPMACTLNQFLEGNKYHFAIRTIDVHGRFGCYSDPISIVYTNRS